MCVYECMIDCVCNGQISSPVIGRSRWRHTWRKAGTRLMRAKRSPRIRGGFSTPAFANVPVCSATKDKSSGQNAEYLSNHWLELTQIWNIGWLNQAKCNLSWKTTSRGKDLKKNETRNISVTTCRISNLKHRLMGPSQILWQMKLKTTFYGRQPLVEEDLKEIKLGISQ